MPARPVIIDCDPGIDDALALLLALAAPDQLDILGITTVAGNVPLDMTTRNALAVCALAGRSDVRVYAGCDRPLVRPLATAAHIHGEAGLGGAELPRPGATAGAAHGVDFIADSLRVRRGGITLAPTGPLTNIACVLSKDPAAAANISEIVLMGGAAGAGNITPHAEFNVFVDPHAAAAVFASGVRLTMIGLDVTRQAVVTPARLAAIGAIGTPAAAAAAAMLSGYSRGAPLHDPCVIAWLLRPDLFAGRPARVTVETEDEETIGRTNVDWGSDQANATVIETVDSAGLFELLIAGLARL